MLTRKITPLLLFSLFCISAQSVFAFTKMTREEYISLHKTDAIKDMMRTGVPASITLAQAVFESEDGNSPLAREANNHFGIKCANDWNGPTYTQDDDKHNECFRKYHSVLESYDDHSAFLKARSRYANLFELKPTDYKAWAKGLKKCGYATNPHYADQLIKIIEDYQLYKMDSGNADNMTASLPSKQNGEGEESSNRIYKPVSSYKHKAHEISYVDISSESRTVSTNNGVPYILAKRGDTYEKIAKEQEQMTALICKYNDADKNDAIKEGQMVYIKPKSRSCSTSFYIAKDGDTLQSISQQFGIKMKMIYKRNNLDKGTEVQAGQKLWLNDKKPNT